MTNGRRLRLVVDATPVTGAGHAMRLATLAEAWMARGGRVETVGNLGLDFVARRYREIGIGDAESAASGADVLVVDSYDPGIRFQAAQEAEPALRVLVDDVGCQVPNGFDVVWNPNPYGSAAFYPGFVGRVLSGSDWVPIREGLPPWRQVRDEVVVALGGGLAARQVLLALAQLAELMPEQAFAIPGPAPSARWRAVAPEAFWRETAGAKALVVAAGATVWEASLVGIPVITLQTADNQRLVYRWTRDAGVPGLNAMMVDADFLAHQLRALLPAARPVPVVPNGARRVAAELAALADARRVA